MLAVVSVASILMKPYKNPSSLPLSELVVNCKGWRDKMNLYCREVVRNGSYFLDSFDTLLTLVSGKTVAD